MITKITQIPKTNINRLRDKIQKTFSKMGEVVANGLAIVIPSIMQSESCSVNQISLQMGKINEKSFHTNDVRLSRLLAHNSFEVEDKIWRCHIKTIFQMLDTSGWLDGRKYILINIDFTTIEDRFLVLSASIQYDNRSIPTFFNMRLYPKYKGMADQKKLEVAMIKELKHLLPTGYKYVLVEDRGFCSERLLEIAEVTGFDYIVRSPRHIYVTSNMGYTKALKTIDSKIKDYGKVTITGTGRKTRLITTCLELKKFEKKDWYIFTSLDDVDFPDVISAYKKRFQIEKNFQDQKSSGFNLEKSKIRKYIRMKRLLFCLYHAQALMVILGDYINVNVEDLKKKLLYSPNPLSVFLS